MLPPVLFTLILLFIDANGFCTLRNLSLPLPRGLRLKKVETLGGKRYRMFMSISLSMLSAHSEKCCELLLS